MAGRTNFIVNGSFEREGGLDAVAYIAAAPGSDPAADGGTYQYRTASPDGWTVTRGILGVETYAPPATPQSWDGKVWTYTHDVTLQQNISGLDRGVVYDLAFVGYDADNPGPSSLEVWWNGQKVAGYDNLSGEAGRLTHVMVTAADGANQLEFRTTGVVVLDDIRLYAAGAPTGIIDFSLTSHPVGVNLGDTVSRTQYVASMSAQHAYVDGVAEALNGIGTVIGGQGNDLLVAGASGADLEGRDGSDALLGGDGNDTLMGGAGSDLVQGGDGHNYLRGDDGSDSILGGRGFDDINGNTGDDAADGGEGDDWVVGGKDNDLLMGGAGADIVYGNLGNDSCVGGTGADIVRGGQGDDTVSGGDGDDFVSGDKGSDTMTGGLGADAFHSFGDAGFDYVTDFNRAQGDRVLLDVGTAYSVRQVGADVVIDMVGDGHLVLLGVSLSSLTGDWIGFN